MPIDRDEALRYEFPKGEGGWSRDDAILYHLGVGAGVPATDPGELEYTYEKNLKVLPSFSTVANVGTLPNLLAVPGMDFNVALMLHGEEEIELHQPLPPEAKLASETRIAEVYDKGKAALLILEVNTVDAEGSPLFTNRMSLFLRGEGGFGGPPSPKARNHAPEREPDGIVESKTLPQQALLYRLNGDKNPLHCDPDFAKLAGFDTPIIHGLCSYGIACKAVVDDALGGDVTQVARYSARFAGIGFPGETFVTRYWRENGSILIECHAKERDAIVISNAAIQLRS
ncbi:MAG: MaoC family dehydratase N-terminal domain-containing protein [Deltaproteobacteria bacterium]|jgi:acyl dehydratase|nr:MaoC family dehydratase N-terminal domain-containing protein [Deltaproteobacteria bacterium]